MKNITIANLGHSDTRNIDSKAEINTVLQDFEAMMLSHFYENFAENIEPDPLTGGGYVEEMYRSFFFSELAKVSAQANGVFLTQDIKNKLYAEYSKK